MVGQLAGVCVSVCVEGVQWWRMLDVACGGKQQLQAATGGGYSCLGGEQCQSGVGVV